ncbi:MAG TPA: O-antigen ligase family protein [Chitinophagales bacterium]|nr:O-antigen ligase family protein [Chitinophagales bacterium]
MNAISKLNLGIFWSYGILTILCISGAFAFDFLPLAGLPILVPVVWLGLTNFSWLYFALLASLPIAFEFSFSSSLSTDLPTEPLMVGLMLVTFFYLLTNPDALSKRFVNHPVLLLLLLYISWFFISALNSLNFTVSFKIFLAKIWYATVFVYLTAIVVNTYERLRIAFWCIFSTMLFATVIIFLRHALTGFGFEEINQCVGPFFINHVNYALMLMAFYPFIWLAATWYKKGSWQKILLDFAKIFFVLAIYFSYTRAAIGAVVLMIPFIYVVKWRLTKVVLAVAVIGAILGVAYIAEGNRYLKHAPEFDETIWHDEFGDHLSATIEGKDVSSMERVYRWIAGARMIADRPLMGVGPGNFYPYYKEYAVTSFETWVSDNEERSTIHNYFLLLWVEQGIVGLLIFVVLTIAIFIVGENTYHAQSLVEDKRIVLTAIVSLMSIYISLMLNDMLETDKIGTLYLFAITLILIMATQGLVHAKREQC